MSEILLAQIGVSRGQPLHVSAGFPYQLLIQHVMVERIAIPVELSFFFAQTITHG